MWSEIEGCSQYFSLGQIFKNREDESQLVSIFSHCLQENQLCPATWLHSLWLKKVTHTTSDYWKKTRGKSCKIHFLPSLEQRELLNISLSVELFQLLRTQVCQSREGSLKNLRLVNTSLKIQTEHELLTFNSPFWKWKDIIALQYKNINNTKQVYISSDFSIAKKSFVTSDLLQLFFGEW